MSFGYHADDGNIYTEKNCMTGVVYGPTFTTGDIIGCGLNLTENSCFFTKNGHHLGTAITGIQ